MSESLRVLVVDDEKIVHQTIGDYLTDLGHRVDDAYDGAEGLEMVRSGEYDVVLVDIKMPVMDGLTMIQEAGQLGSGTAFVVLTAHTDMDTVVGSLRVGAADFVKKPVGLREIEAVLERTALMNRLRRDAGRLRQTIGRIQSYESWRAGMSEFVGVSGASEDVRRLIGQAVEAAFDTVLITGDTGTGKEVAARSLHLSALGEGRPFIPLSCPALPEALVESELFGHVKGAFTGANTDREGCFSLADGGTLFLDEVGDLSAPAQAKLLRALETRSFRKVGSSKEVTVDIRVTAATNAALDRLVESGGFRRDLYYRLNSFCIHIPPLRERPEDIIPLAEHFLAAYEEAKEAGVRGFTKDAERALCAYDYPGNVRELRNVVERAAAICRDDAISAEYLFLPGSGEGPAPKEPGEAAGEGDERKRILDALQQARWNRRRAAEVLGMPYSTMRYRMQKLGIS
jgi:DNA-binding NtrC family response regulator